MSAQSKPKRTSRSRHGRRTLTLRHAFYEAEKWLWQIYHPNASAAEYQAAMGLIAKRCGV